MPHASATVTFVELTGPGARGRLETLSAALPPGSAPELLRGLAPEDLWLLVIRGVEPGADALPAEARVWRFVTAMEAV